MDDKVVGRAGAFARHLKNIARACLYQAHLDAGIFGRVVDHADKGFERGLGRNLDFFGRARIGEFEILVSAGIIDDIGFGAEHMPGIGPNGVVGRLQHIDAVLHVLSRGIGHSGKNMFVARGNVLGDEIVSVAQGSEHVAGDLDLLNDGAKRLIAQIPVGLPRGQTVELNGLHPFKLGKHGIEVGSHVAQARYGV